VVTLMGLRETLDAATPGPWEAWDNHHGAWVVEAESEIVTDSVVARSARLIALAPELAAGNLEAVERLREIKADVESFAETSGILVTDPRKIDALLARLDQIGVADETQLGKEQTP
jgi:hypothetical protein